MAWTRPSLSTLRTQFRDRIKSSMADAGYSVDAAIPRTIVKVIGDVVAAGFHVAYGALEWLADQVLPDKASEPWLTRHARLYGMTKNPAVAWVGTATFTGSNGTVIPDDHPLVRADGAVYYTSASGTISGGTATLAIRAETAGADGALDVAQTIALGSPVAGLDSEVTVAAETTPAADEETLAEFRERVLERIAEQPQGGAALDYERWAREITGVFRALGVSVPRGGGSVDVYFLHDEGTGYGIPTSPQITEVQDYIDTKRPVGITDVQVKAPTTTEVDYTFTVLSPDTSAIRTAIAAQLEALFLAKALSVNADGTTKTIYVSDHWEAALSGARAATSAAPAVKITVPSADLTPALGEVYILGTITWPS